MRSIKELIRLTFNRRIFFSFKETIYYHEYAMLQSGVIICIHF